MYKSYNPFVNWSIFLEATSVLVEMESPLEPVPVDMGCAAHVRFFYSCGPFSYLHAHYVNDWMVFLTVTIRCGGSTSENCTYFESQGTESGSCTSTICRSNSNVCQIRLDFNNFVLSGPDGGTVTTTKILNGLPAGSVNAIAARPATQCNVDSFSVTNPTGKAPAVLCGINTGEHCKV